MPRELKESARSARVCGTLRAARPAKRTRDRQGVQSRMRLHSLMGSQFKHACRPALSTPDRPARELQQGGSTQ
eukprot:363148-Chlamydomonas_euryale.AAC.3